MAGEKRTPAMFNRANSASAKSFPAYSAASRWSFPSLNQNIPLSTSWKIPVSSRTISEATSEKNSRVGPRHIPASSNVTCTGPDVSPGYRDIAEVNSWPRVTLSICPQMAREAPSVCSRYSKRRRRLVWSSKPGTRENDGRSSGFVRRYSLR
jgi:hypothetical protein